MTDRKKTGSGRKSRASTRTSSRTRARAQAAASKTPSQRVQQSLEEAEAEAVKAAMEKRATTETDPQKPAEPAETVGEDEAKHLKRERGEAEDAEILSETEAAAPDDETPAAEEKPAASPGPEPIFATRTKPKNDAPERAPSGFPFAVVVAAALAGGLVGAVAVLIGGSQANLFGTDMAPLEQRVAAIEGRSSTSVEALETRLGKLEQQVGSVAATPAADPGAAEERRVLQEAQNQLGEANRSLTERLAALEAGQSEREAADAQTLETLRAEIAAMAGSGASGGAATGGAVSDPRVAGLEQRLNAVEEQTKALASAAQSGAPQADVAAEAEALNEKIAGLQSSIATLQDQLAGGAEDARDAAGMLTKLDARITKLETESKAFAQGEAAIGVAFGMLSQAVAGSAPYADALATVESIAEVKAAPALKDHAKTGLPSVGSLSARFDGASRDALAALAQAEADEEGGVADAIAKRLSSFVVIRRTEESEGDDPASVLSRAEARIDEGDVAAALSEVDKLPQAAQSGMGDWLRDARIRADAEAALDDLRRELLPAQ